MVGLPTQAFRERRLLTDLDKACLSKKRKFFDPRMARVSVRILPGEQYVAETPKEVLVTILGSCVAACIRDPRSGIGGMNHFMMPRSENGQWGQASDALRYGNHAMESLIKEMVKRGADRDSLEIKVFGGANVTKGSIHLIGDQNCDFIRHYLQHEGLACGAYDLGGQRARRIQYFPDSGRVKRQFLKRSNDARMIEDETAYFDRISGEAGPARTETGTETGTETSDRGPQR